MCPHCRQNAPIVYRGTLAYCTACNAPRPPFSSKSVNLAGQPSKIGGTVARVAGWLILGVGLFIGLMVMWVLQLLFPAGLAGYALGVPIVLLSLIVGLIALFSGKKLHTSGVEAERSAKFEAIHAMAWTRGGAVTALDVGRTLGMRTEEADALLTAMTKAHPDYVSIEVDDYGNLFYKLAGVAMPKEAAFGTKYRVAPDGYVRIEDELAEGRRQQAEAEAMEAWQQEQQRRSSR